MTLTTLQESSGSASPAGTRTTTLVLVHGYLGAAEQWRQQVAALSDRFHVVAVDLPGFGKAASEATLPTIEDYADHVLATLDRMGVDRFILLGHSMGGMIAQEMAQRAPERITRLVLYGTGPLGRMPDRFEPLDVSLNRLAQDGVEKTARRIVATWFAQGEDHPGFQLLNRIGAGSSADAAQSALLAMAGWDGRANLSRIAMPTLVLWGDRDRSYRWPQVETLWQALPDASLAVIPGASHAAHLEKPDIFMAILQDYLADPAG